MKHIYIWVNEDATNIRAFVNKRSFDGAVKELINEAMMENEACGAEVTKQIKDAMNRGVQKVELE